MRKVQVATLTSSYVDLLCLVLHTYIDVGGIDIVTLTVRTASHGLEYDTIVIIY